MLTGYSFLQKVFRAAGCGVKRTAEKARRHKTALLCAGLLLAAAGLSLGDPGAENSGSLTAFAETPAVTVKETERETEESNELTAEKIEEEAEDPIRQGQQLVGSLLMQGIREDEQEREEFSKEMTQALRQARREELNRKNGKAENAQKEPEQPVLSEDGEKIAEEIALEQTEELPVVRKAASAVSYTESDYQVLLKIVEAEAGICDEKGKILVANVVLNRVRSKKFPNTITEVVYQKKQFSPVANGKIDTCTVTKETIDCVNRALGGEDYSQGALYFMYRQGSSAGAASWFDRDLTFLFSHGRHEFFK